MDSAAYIFLTPLYFLLPFQMMLVVLVVVVVVVVMMMMMMIIIIIIGKDNRPGEDFAPSTAISAVRWAIFLSILQATLFET
jgi:hypothetical protein